MSTITFNDGRFPYAYPSTVGSSITSSINSTGKILGIFKNNTNGGHALAGLQLFNFSIVSTTADCLVTIQLVGDVSATDGAFADILSGYSKLQINTTATAYTGGVVALTLYANAYTAHGNTHSSFSPINGNAEELGLILRKLKQFAIVARTNNSGVVNIAWSVNWYEQLTQEQIEL